MRYAKIGGASSALASLSLVLAFGSTGSAQRALAHTDSMLLRSDLVVFADVTAVVPVVESRLVTVRLGNARVVANRFRQVPTEFRVRASDTASGAVEFGHYQRLEEGKRYLFFFRGGRWHSSPLIQFGTPLFPVREDGTVLCAGGEVYGINSHGLACSTTERQAGAPIKEERLAALLTSRRARAVRHRRAEAAEEDAADRELRLLPVFSR